MTERTIFDHLAEWEAEDVEQAKREAAKAARRAADIQTLKQLFAWLRNYLSKVDVREFNSVLVDYAEHILADPQSYPDNEWNRHVGGDYSFLGLVLRETAKTTTTRPYSAALMELAGSIHASIDYLDFDLPKAFEVACGIAFDLAGLQSSGLYRVEKKAKATYLLGTKTLRRQFGITVRVQ